MGTGGGYRSRVGANAGCHLKIPELRKIFGGGIRVLLYIAKHRFIKSIFGAQNRAGFLNEHPEGFYAVTADFKEYPEGSFRLPEPLNGLFPLTFTLRSTK